MSLKIKIEGEGTRYDIAEALRSIANSLFSKNLDEIYNINGAEYNDGTCLVELIDIENQ